jgi:hypothetical protein
MTGYCVDSNGTLWSVERVGCLGQMREYQLFVTTFRTSYIYIYFYLGGSCADMFSNL